jgi:hypothetical protein
MNQHESKEMIQVDLGVKPPMSRLTEEQITKPGSWRRAIIATAEAAGFEDKKAADAMGFAQEMWSRLKTDMRTGINPDRIEAFMDNCGNELLLHNLAHRRGYRLVEIETETARKLREVTDQLEKERMERQIVEETMRRILTGAGVSK